MERIILSGGSERTRSPKSLEFHRRPFNGNPEYTTALWLSELETLKPSNNPATNTAETEAAPSIEETRYGQDVRKADLANLKGDLLPKDSQQYTHELLSKMTTSACHSFEHLSGRTGLLLVALTRAIHILYDYHNTELTADETESFRKIVDALYDFINPLPVLARTYKVVDSSRLPNSNQISLESNTYHIVIAQQTLKQTEQIKQELEERKLALSMKGLSPEQVVDRTNPTLENDKPPQLEITIKDSSDTELGKITLVDDQKTEYPVKIELASGKTVGSINLLECTGHTGFRRDLIENKDSFQLATDDLFNEAKLVKKQNIEAQLNEKRRIMKLALDQQQSLMKLGKKIEEAKAQGAHEQVAKLQAKYHNTWLELAKLESQIKGYQQRED